MATRRRQRPRPEETTQTRRIATAREARRKVTRVSDWLFDRMAEREWSQPDLARASGVSQPYLSKILLHGGLPEDDKAQRLARAVKTPDSELLIVLVADRLERLFEHASPAVRQHYAATLADVRRTKA